MKERLDEYQGRTQEQQDSNEALGAFSIILLIALVVIIAIYKLLGMCL